MIPTSKTGTCSQCGDVNAPCVKIGKELFCVRICNKLKKIKAQAQRAREKLAVRSLGVYQKNEAILSSLQELTIDLDRTISRYVRLRDMEPDGKITCYCCDKRIPWTMAHCMHFINREHLNTRFLLLNLRSGCFECNVEKKGNIPVFKARLELERPGTVEFLEEQAHTVASPSRSDLKELLFDFRQKLRLVESKLK